jgi:protocatechuate 3,4-dioxygenase beta subunit
MNRLLLPLGLLLLPCAILAQSPKPPEPRKEDLCKISGSAVKLAGGEPLRKARVGLQSEEDPTRSISTVTDAGGLFTLKGIEPGRYRLSVSRNGFVVQEYGQRKPHEPGAILTLRSGQEMKDLIFRLIPSGVIAGRILDEDGEPLPYVQVMAVRQTYSEGKRILAPVQGASTNDLGEYRLFGLSPGRYLISAVYPQWGRFGWGGGDDAGGDASGEQGYAKMYYPGTADAPKASTITINAGEEINSIDILMRQVRVYHIRGHLYNQITRKSGREAIVFLRPRNSGQDWDFGQQQTWVEKKDGSFNIAEVLPGSYVLMAFWSDEGKQVTARTVVDVGNADVDGVALTLGAGVNIAGHVSWDGQSSLESNELSVALRPTDTGRHYWGGEGARVDTNNSFTLKDVSEAAYNVEVSGESRDCYIKEVRYGSSTALDEGFTVTRSNPASLEITISSRGARLQGTVSDEDGLPAAGVQVVLVPEAARRNLHRLYKSATTDQYGRFDIRGVAPGDYSLFSWEEVESGAWEDSEFLKPFEKKSQSVSVQDGDKKTVNLTAIRTRTSKSSAQ